MSEKDRNGLTDEDLLKLYTSLTFTSAAEAPYWEGNPDNIIIAIDEKLAEYERKREYERKKREYERKKRENDALRRERIKNIQPWVKVAQKRKQKQKQRNEGKEKQKQKGNKAETKEDKLRKGEKDKFVSL